MNTPTHNPCEAAQTVGRCYGVSHVKQFGTLPLLAACYRVAGVLCFGEVPALCFSANNKVRTETGTVTTIGEARTRKASVTDSAPKQAHRTPPLRTPNATGWLVSSVLRFTAPTFVDFACHAPLERLPNPQKRTLDR